MKNKEPSQSNSDVCIGENPTQITTNSLLAWLRIKSLENGGQIPYQMQNEVIDQLDLPIILKFGLMLDRVQARLDFACFLIGLPPIGMTIERPHGWPYQSADKGWVFPIDDLVRAATSQAWTDDAFASLVALNMRLPSDDNVIWIGALEKFNAKLYRWAYSFSIDSKKLSVIENAVSSVEHTNSIPTPLTKRETQILSAMGKGLSFKGIGTIHNISPHTVARHVKRIYSKLGVHSRGEAVFEGSRAGLI